MWVLKGTMLGLWFLGFGTMAWLYFVLYRNLPPNSAVEIRIFTSLTTQNQYCPGKLWTVPANPLIKQG
jgi:hypothetical protein